jgi:hypothetical protein
MLSLSRLGGLAIFLGFDRGVRARGGRRKWCGSNDEAFDGALKVEQQQGSATFLKKSRQKNLLVEARVFDRAWAPSEKVFWFFFSKKNPFSFDFFKMNRCVRLTTVQDGGSQVPDR